MAGVPIRLVRKDGKLIELNCTDYQVNITRSLITVPIPITAERFGADLNMVQAEIIIECILVDDDCGDIAYGQSYSEATIDFSYRRPKEGDNNTAHTAWIENSTMILNEGLDGAIFNFTSTDGTKFTVTLKNTGASTSGNDIQVDIDGIETAAAMVTAIKAALDAHTVFLSKFTVTAGVGANGNLSGNTKLDFTQKTSGSGGATATPTFVANTDYEPHISVFSDVDDGGCYSAGDKIQNIIATVSNNSVLGAMGKAFEIGSFPGLDIGENDGMFFGSKKSDYIIGLQLPYNSLYEASLSNVGNPVAGYNVRNMLIVTGGAMATNLKDASSNKLDASSDFIFTDKHTGISGTVKTASIKYDAGETIYRATLTFQPLDFVLGVG